MKGYLSPGEEVRAVSRPHGISLVRPLGGALLAAGAGAVCVVLGAPVHWSLAAIGAAALALAALCALGAVWRWDCTAVVLTTDKLFVAYGIVRRRAAAVRLDRIQAVEIEQSLTGRLLGYGTLVAGELEIPHVPRARELVRMLG